MEWDNKKTLPISLLARTLATSLESDATQFSHQESPTTTPIIHKFQQRGPERKPRFQYKNPKQCDGCHKFGHCITSQTCNFIGMLSYAQEYIQQNPDLVKLNKQAFHAANTSAQINKINSESPPHLTQEEVKEENQIRIWQVLSAANNDDTSTLT